MKRLFIIILSAICVGACAAAIGCGADRPLHIWSDKWSSNAQTHWHPCTDDGCPGKDSLEYHNFNLTKTITEATCSAEGEGEYTCPVCGYTKKDIIEKIPHKLELLENQNYQPPTCYTPGYGDYRCSVCKEVLEHQDIPATGEHKISAGYHSDDKGHWHYCTTPGCSYKEESSPHTDGKVTETPPIGWDDGTKSTACAVCQAEIKNEPIPSPYAPVSFTLGLSSANGDVTFTPREAENGIDAFDCTLLYNNLYNISLLNAVNANGDSLNDVEGTTLPDINSNLKWTIGGQGTLRGLKGYYINDRNAEELMDNPYQKYQNIEFSGDTIRSTRGNASPAIKIVLRFETGINDNNYHTRKIRASVIIYIKTVSSGTASAPALTCGLPAATNEELRRRTGKI